MHEAKSKFAQKLPLILLTAALANGALGENLARNADRNPHCLEPTLILLGDRHSDELADDVEAICYQVAVEHPGVIVASVSSHQLEPKLRLHATGSGKAVVLPGTGSSQLVLQVLEPGSLTFEIAAQDPRSRSGSYIFTSRFVAETDAIGVKLDATALPIATKEGDEIDPVLLTGGPFAKEGDEIDPVLLTGGPFAKEGDEIDPVLLIDAPPGARHLQIQRPGFLLFSSGRAALVQPGDELMIRAGIGKRVTARFYDFCYPDPEDDHASLFACASSLQAKGSLSSTLVNDWTDDHDVFTFVLKNRRTVTFDTSGEVSTTGALLDQQGQRLAIFEDNDDAHFRFVRTLAPGRYFVRIIGRDGAQGRYSVNLATSAW